MARTIDEIQDSIKADFIKNTTLIDSYSLDTTKSFDNQFSKVALESILIYIISVAINLFEKVLDKNKSEIEHIISSQKLMGYAYYQTKAFEFQYGHHLVYNPDNYTYEYPSIDESAKIIKYCSVREYKDDGVTKLRIMVSGRDGAALTTNQKNAFLKYLEYVGAAGIHYSMISQAPTKIGFSMTIYRDSLLLSGQGTLYKDDSKPVEDAIKRYLNTLDYAGKFNRNKFIAALLEAEGVRDVLLTNVMTGESGTVNNSANVESDGGLFEFYSATSVISYSL